jgi:hypothetical protein
MDIQLLIICALMFVVHVVATLAYAVRIAGVRTRRIAVSFALFGIIALVSRTANSFQGPFLAKRVEYAWRKPSKAVACVDSFTGAFDRWFLSHPNGDHPAGSVYW